MPKHALVRRDVQIVNRAGRARERNEAHEQERERDAVHALPCFTRQRRPISAMALPPSMPFAFSSGICSFTKSA